MGSSIPRYICSGLDTKIYKDQHNFVKKEHNNHILHVFLLSYKKWNFQSININPFCQSLVCIDVSENKNKIRTTSPTVVIIIESRKTKSDLHAKMLSAIKFPPTNYSIIKIKLTSHQS